MRSETEYFVQYGLLNFGNVEVYSLHDIEWRNVTVSMKDRFERGRPKPGVDFNDVTVAVHANVIERRGKYFMVAAPIIDMAASMTKALKEAGLDHVFVFTKFMRGLSIRNRTDRYPYEDYKKEDASYFERGYSHRYQPSITHVAFATETDAVAGQAILDMIPDDEFARAS